MNLQKGFNCQEETNEAEITIINITKHIFNIK